MYVCICVHAYYACICMHVYYVCIVCTHAYSTCILCMHAMHICILCIHIMHAYACIHNIFRYKSNLMIKTLQIHDEWQILQNINWISMWLKSDLNEMKKYICSYCLRRYISRAKALWQEIEYNSYISILSYLKIMQADIRRMLFNKMRNNLCVYFDIHIQATQNYLNEIKEVRDVEKYSK